MRKRTIIDKIRQPYCDAYQELDYCCFDRPDHYDMFIEQQGYPSNILFIIKNSCIYVSVEENV